MAASLGAVMRGNFLRITTVLRSQTLTVECPRLYATSCKDQDSSRLPRIAAAPDNSCILCWHPEPEFPYECTQPLPRKQEDYADGDSPLKTDVVLRQQTKQRPEGPTDHELSNIFYTTKHQWRPMTMKKYKNPNPIKDRDGL